MSQEKFKALCTIASGENWCWNILCKTCGNLLFRFGLNQLALGSDPSSPDWIIHKSNLSILGPEPPRWKWPIEKQRHLIFAVRETDIRDLASTTPFPEWLGYLGMVLFYTEDAEAECHELSQAWAPQLLNLINPNSAACDLLTEITIEKSKTLKWSSLKTIELDFRDLDLELGFLPLRPS